jgi:hypothetical protein
MPTVILVAGALDYAHKRGLLGPAVMSGRLSSVNLLVAQKQIDPPAFRSIYLS